MTQRRSPKETSQRTPPRYEYGVPASDFRPYFVAFDFGNGDGPAGWGFIDDTGGRNSRFYTTEASGSSVIYNSLTLSPSYTGLATSFNVNGYISAPTTTTTVGIRATVNSPGLSLSGIPIGTYQISRNFSEDTLGRTGTTSFTSTTSISRFVTLTPSENLIQRIGVGGPAINLKQNGGFYIEGPPATLRYLDTNQSEKTVPVGDVWLESPTLTVSWVTPDGGDPKAMSSFASLEMYAGFQSPSWYSVRYQK